MTTLNIVDVAKTQTEDTWCQGRYREVRDIGGERFCRVGWLLDKAGVDWGHVRLLPDRGPGPGEYSPRDAYLADIWQTACGLAFAATQGIAASNDIDGFEDSLETVIEAESRWGLIDCRPEHGGCTHDHQ